MAMAIFRLSLHLYLLIRRALYESIVKYGNFRAESCLVRFYIKFCDCFQTIVMLSMCKIKDNIVVFSVN